MPRGTYPPELTKTDPLRTLHIKIPVSATATLNKIAAKLDRPTSWVVREVLTEHALKVRKEEQGRK